MTKLSFWADVVTDLLGFFLILLQKKRNLYCSGLVYETRGLYSNPNTLLEHLWYIQTIKTLNKKQFMFRCICLNNNVKKMCQIAQLVLKLLLFRDLWKISRQLYISLLMLDRMWVGKLLDFHIFINHGSTRNQSGEQTLLSAPLEEVERSCLKKTKTKLFIMSLLLLDSAQMSVNNSCFLC